MIVFYFADLFCHNVLARVFQLFRTVNRFGNDWRKPVVEPNRA
jgi:hypothetical protein